MVDPKTKSTRSSHHVLEVKIDILPKDRAIIVNNAVGTGRTPQTGRWPTKHREQDSKMPESFPISDIYLAIFNDDARGG